MITAREQLEAAPKIRRSSDDPNRAQTYKLHPKFGWTKDSGPVRGLFTEPDREADPDWGTDLTYLLDRLAVEDHFRQVDAAAGRAERLAGRVADQASLHRQEASPELRPGAIVHAADQNNYGRVITLNGRSAVVYFFNRETDCAAEVELPLSLLTPVR